MNSHKHAKYQFLPSVNFWDKVNFRVLWPDWPRPFLTMSTQKNFDYLLIYVNLYQHAKNQTILLICSGDMAHQKILQSDWLKTFWPISQGQKMCWNTANNISFHYTVKPVLTTTILKQPPVLNDHVVVLP